MKIDEGIINHNALRLIGELIDSRYELIMNEDKTKEERGYMLMTLGEIGGIIEMAKSMKEVMMS